MKYIKQFLVEVCWLIVITLICLVIGYVFYTWRF